MREIGIELASVIRSYGYVCDEYAPETHEPLFGKPRYRITCSGYTYTVRDRGGIWEVAPD